MTQERGGYCSIRRVLLDGPDFQKLSERARWVFIALKLNMGPSGIDVFYPSALVFQLAAQTGASPNAVTEALVELEESGWLLREQNVVWLIGHLKHDPHVSASDSKHRKSVGRHLSGLPRLDIVRAFVVAHPEFFPPTDSPLPELAWAIEGPSKGHRSREYEKEYEKESRVRKKRSPAADAAAPRANWVDRIATHWNANVGRIAPGHVGASAKPAVDEHGIDLVERAMLAYIAQMQAGGKDCKWKWFLENISQWIARVSGPIDVVDGEMTDTLELLTRPSGARRVG